MPLVSIAEMMSHARRQGYAVGYFESWNLESLEGVVDAAERARAPVILGFNGEFLSRAERVAGERLRLYAALGRAAAEEAAVPCGFIFNECPDDAWTVRAAELGFNLVMPADAHAGAEEYARRVRRIVQQVHPRGVAVEAEIGQLPCGAEGRISQDGSATDPAAAGEFVGETGIDLLAVSVGNIHIRVEGEQGLDLARLAAVRQRVSIPLVLHGGTGISAGSLRGAIELGVAKVNYGTYIKQRVIRDLRAALAEEMLNPHELLGMGGRGDLMVAVRQAVREAVLERIGLLNCCGKA